MSGTPIAQVEFVKTFQHWTRGDRACFPLDVARDLVARRLATGLPPPVGAVKDEEGTPQKRVPETVVKK
jgi:hypothetical protein